MRKSSTLPTNVEPNIPEFGIENAPLKFVEDPDKGPDETTWFNFDRLVVQTGSATLEPQSQEQLTNIVEILKAFQAVIVKIGGHTDNMGDPAANMKLSQDRATNVMNEIIKAGLCVSCAPPVARALCARSRSSCVMAVTPARAALNFVR